VLTSVGHVTVARRYYYCRGCRAGDSPWDGWAGLAGGRSLSEHARQMVTLAGMSWPFDRAARHLKALCRIDVSDDTIERVCQEEGEAARRWMGCSPAPVRAFARAAGRAEFSTDGVTVNTVGGWREMRLSVLARREPAAACAPAGWAGRVLNEPTVRLASCMIAGAGHVGASWGRLSRRVDLAREPVVGVIADGARWIWDQAARRLPRHNAEWCVDVYHVSQHLHACGRAIHGEGSAARSWADERLMTALACNGVGLIDRLEQERRAADPDAARAIDRLLGYLGDNRDSLWYAQRLAAGLPIGSGLIEGACKNTIAARLKANSARWRVRRVERIGALRCLDSSDQWTDYWAARAA
jgi:hypothetical protein